MAGRDHWLSVASGPTEDVREWILTGYKAGKPFTPYVPTLALPSAIERALDFGCGLGRNFPYLKRVARWVAGYDLAPMIERCRETASDPVDLLTSDWSALASERFDLIFASLVLQHIEPGPVRAFLRDFARMAPAVYLLTRRRTDFDESVFDIIAEVGLHRVVDCVEVDHDPATHQLRVLGRGMHPVSGPDASTRHFEVLLQTA